MNQKRIADLESHVRLLLAWHHAWRTWQLPYRDKYINKLCFIFQIISNGLTFWNTRLKSSNKRALLEKIMPLCVLCKSCVTSHVANWQKSQKHRTCWHTVWLTVALIFSGFKFLWFSRFFHDPQKKVPAEKNNFRKNLLHCRNLYTNIAFYMSCNIMLVPIYLNRLFRSKIKRN